MIYFFNASIKNLDLIFEYGKQKEQTNGYT